MTMERPTGLPGTGSLAAFFEPEIRAWHGAEPLGKVFWGYGILGSAALLGFELQTIYQDRPFLQQAVLLCFAAYTAWFLVSAWRCADNARPVWGVFVRLLTVAWVGNTVLAVGFLQIDLIARFAGLTG